MSSLGGWYLHRHFCLPHLLRCPSGQLQGRQYLTYEGKYLQFNSNFAFSRPCWHCDRHCFRKLACFSSALLCCTLQTSNDAACLPNFSTMLCRCGFVIVGSIHKYHRISKTHDTHLYKLKRQNGSTNPHYPCQTTLFKGNAFSDLQLKFLVSHHEVTVSSWHSLRKDCMYSSSIVADF